MSILIKGMEMPTSCYVCPFCDYVSARCDAVKGNPYTPESRYEKRADFCPLVPILPHGRLIDADALHKLFIEKGKEFKDVGGAMLAAAAWCIANAPTIIPAEEEVYDKYTDTVGNLHWTGTKSGEHILKAEEGE